MFMFSGGWVVRLVAFRCCLCHCVRCGGCAQSIVLNSRLKAVGGVRRGASRRLRSVGVGLSGLMGNNKGVYCLKGADGARGLG
ncbi:hypothetical protein EDB84DRAFT_1060178 [Lactarius hengduanensis]|nr:hypothetical protein EDB84DRAFT_1060178 [Lactarius hengduanensis]